MKILIMVDMEGISGITSSDQVNADSGRFYAEGRQYVTWETNACIDGCFAGGADEVIVRDAHMYGKNLLWEQLDPRAQYVVGQTGDIRLTQDQRMLLRLILFISAHIMAYFIVKIIRWRRIGDKMPYSIQAVLGTIRCCSCCTEIGLTSFRNYFLQSINPSHLPQQ